MWRLKMPCRALAFLHRWRILALPHTSALMTKSIYTSKRVHHRSDRKAAFCLLSYRLGQEFHP